MKIRNEKEVQKLIILAKKHNWLVGAFGLGIWGKNYGLKFIEWLHINLDFVSDSNDEKVKDFQSENLHAIDIETLMAIKEKTLLFVNIGQFYIEEVVQRLSGNKYLYIITIDEVMNLDSIVKKFYDVTDIKKLQSLKGKKRNVTVDEENFLTYDRKEKIAIYTCIIGGYDDVHEPQVEEENCDYFLISDEKPNNLKVFKWIDAKEVVPQSIIEPAAINRYCKMHGDIILKEYKYSIYMDGKIELVRGISHYIKEIGKSGLAIHRHGFIDCIYTEGIRMVGCGECDYESVKKQMQEYILEGMPRNFGQFECCIIVRKNENEIGKKVMREWFQEYMKGQRRDQFSLPYILWKNGLTKDCIGELYNGIPWKDNHDFIRYKNHPGKVL